MIEMPQKLPPSLYKVVQYRRNAIEIQTQLGKGGGGGEMVGVLGSKSKMFYVSHRIKDKVLDKNLRLQILGSILNDKSDMNYTEEIHVVVAFCEL